MEIRNIHVAVIDGQGGGIGRALAEQLKKTYPELKIRALGTNSAATAAMLKGGADEGATGENAVIWNSARMDMILGPIGIIRANGLMGEVTPAMAAAVSDSKAVKILIPSRRCGIRVAGAADLPLQALFKDALQIFGEELEALTR